MALERDLVDYVAANPDLIEEGMTVVGREAVIGGVRPDLLLRDRHGDPVIAEFKRGSATREAVGQLMEYIGLIAPSHPAVRGFLIAKRIPTSVGTALLHHGLEHKEITLPQEPPVPPTPFDAAQPLDADSDAITEVVAALSAGLVGATPGEARLLPAGKVAYPLYLRASMYCCPVDHPFLMGKLPLYLAFYDKGVKRQIACIRDVIDMRVDDVASHGDRIRAVGRDPGAIERALGEWRAWGRGSKPSGRSYESARVALLSAAGEPDTILLPREIGGAVGVGQGHQNRAEFDLDDLRTAATYAELKALRKRRVGR